MIQCTLTLCTDTVTHTHTPTPTHTWLCKGPDGGHDVETVTLSGDDQVQLLEGLGVDDEGVAPGR